MPDAENTELIKRAQTGDAAAFEALANQYYGVMFKMAFKWCGDRTAAEDITQEACIKLARGIDSFRHDSAFTSWLYRLVINTAKDWFKSQNRHPATDMEQAANIKAEESAPDDKILMQQVWAQIQTLPEGEKEALLLVVGEGLSHKEAAQILEVKESTVSWRIHEARKKLESLFGKEKKYG
ncbi:MAG: RNA polymerase sigma factor [Rhodospirillales bacterium]|nr:RNA polymerase sigma factor [Alphaproteobacteria bacterium]MCB9977711.1 RNA polymerase sigma factor [Rhodospirillales bacterium]